MRTGAVDAFTLTDLEPTAADFRAEFMAGLRRRPRRLPCKFFYDERGSVLFDQICELPEYYPTRTEFGILRQHGREIAEFCGPECLLVELGSGSSKKTRVLLDALDAPAGYMPIDISRSQLERAAARLVLEYPAVDILPVCADYARAIQLPTPAALVRKNVIFFPGSTIGNFEPNEATAFLRHVATWCRAGDRMIVGVDLAKSRDVLESAYNDRREITAAFNLNLLVRANSELGANFRTDRFSHRAVFDAEQSRIEMLLISEKTQSVRVGDEQFDFESEERIVTEYSYKHSAQDFARIASAANWNVVARWVDRQGWFGVFGLELQ